MWACPTFIYCTKERGVSQAEAYIDPHCGTIPLLDMSNHNISPVEEGTTSKRERGTPNPHGKGISIVPTNEEKQKSNAKNLIL